jgi:hypothetical protein
VSKRVLITGATRVVAARMRRLAGRGLFDRSELVGEFAARVRV